MKIHKNFVKSGVWINSFNRISDKLACDLEYKAIEKGANVLKC
jgi:hypothetical protein